MEKDERLLGVLYPVVYVTDKARNGDDIVNYPASVADATKLGLFFISSFSGDLHLEFLLLFP